MMILKYLLIAIIIALFSTACSTPIQVIVSNYEDSNLNNRGDNVPITLIVYQLKDSKKFEYASPKDLISRESVALGRDKIDSIKIQVPPNEKEILVAEFNEKEGDYIGILALFSNIKGKKQKFYKKLNSVFENIIKINITKNGITEFDDNTK